MVIAFAHFRSRASGFTSHKFLAAPIICKPAMHTTSVIREFVSNIRTSDVFVGHKKVTVHARFRPGEKSKSGDFFCVNKSFDPSDLWVIGRVTTSDRDLIVKPDGSYQSQFAASPDKALRDACFRLVLVDPEDDVVGPLFRSAVGGIKAIQGLYPNRDHQHLLDSSGGFDKIRLTVLQGASSDAMPIG